MEFLAEWEAHLHTDAASQVLHVMQHNVSIKTNKQRQGITSMSGGNVWKSFTLLDSQHE